jgi:hypothetical protein
LHKTHGAQNGGRILHNGTDRSVPTDTMSSFSAWLNTVEGNKEKQEKNTINEARGMPAPMGTTCTPVPAHVV